MTTQLFSRIFSAIRRGRRRRAAIQELSALNDHVLRDIGLERGDIHRAVDSLMDAEDRAGSRRPHVHEILLPVESRGRPRPVEAAEEDVVIPQSATAIVSAGWRPMRHGNSHHDQTSSG